MTDVKYIGSITVGQPLLERIDLWVGELVHFWNVTNGERFTTYALRGEPGFGDIVIIASFALSDDPMTPKAIPVDDNNRYPQDL